MTRMFVGIWLPVHVHDALRRLVRPELAVRWAPEQNWHATLLFLGDGDPHDAAARLRRLIAPAHPVTATIGGGLEWLGAAHGRRSLVARVSGLDELAVAVRSAMGDVTHPAACEFRGHVTLGQAQPGEVGVTPALDLPVVFDVDTVHLIASELRSAGATYSTLTDVSLRG